MLREYLSPEQIAGSLGGDLIKGKGKANANASSVGTLVERIADQAERRDGDLGDGRLQRGA